MLQLIGMTEHEDEQPLGVEPEKARPRRRRSFGAIRKVKSSGRYQASYMGPDGVRHLAPDTFDTESAVDDWLAQVPR